MRLAFSTNAYMKFPFEEAATRIAALGYQGLELMADVPHAWPAGLLEGPKRAILAAMERNSLGFSNINAFMMNAINDHRHPYLHPSFLEADEGYRRVRIDHTRRALDLCKELGAPHITTEPGGPLPPGMSRQAGIDRFVESLKPLAEHAQNLGVLLLIEPEPHLLLETSDQYLEVAERLDAPSIGLNFDVGHAFCVSEDIPRSIAKLAPQIRHYHFEDIAATRVHHHLVPGQGAIDFAEVIQAIQTTGYDGWITVELYPNIDDPDAAARGAIELLKPLLTPDDGGLEPAMNRLKPYFQLVRLPNLFTAAADSLAGWLIVRGSLEEPSRWLPLVLASVAIYAAGIVLNDVFDVEVDRLERPNRPLPSGRVSWRLAAWFGGIALASGPLLAALTGSMASFAVALALAACVLAYDAGLKKTWLGPEAMGACRGLNLLLGMSQGPTLGGPSAWLIAGSLALFVVGVTWISRSEVATGQRRGIALGVGIEQWALLGLIAASIATARGPGVAAPGIQTEVFGLVVWLVVVVVINRANFEALKTPVPALIQRAVKTGVLSLVWLDVVAVTTARGPTAGLTVAGLWVPAFLLGKWLYST